MFVDPQWEVSVKLSAPLFALRAQAKKIKKEQSVSLAEALNLVARREGFASWSLLQSKAKDLRPRREEDILDYLNPGDLVLVASRPGLGKTTFTLRLLLRAFHRGRRCFFFTLESSRRELARKIAALDETVGETNPNLRFDFSDEISAEDIARKTSTGNLEGAVLAVDYLQLLDQRRDKPALQLQIEALKAFAGKHGCILIFISQVDRSFEGSGRAHPGLEDVRLPNPLDLKLFNKAIFLHGGKKIFVAPERFEITGETADPIPAPESGRRRITP